MVILSGDRQPVLVPVLVQLLVADLGGGQHAAEAGLGGEEEPCLRSALWTHTVICSS